MKADIWTVLSLATELSRMGKDGTLHWTPWFWLLSLSQYLDMMHNLKIQLQARPKALPNCICYSELWILTWVLTLILKRRGTKIFPSNYIAADLFHPKNLCEKFYSNYYHYREQSLVNSLLNFPVDHLLEVLVKWKEFILNKQFSIFVFLDAIASLGLTYGRFLSPFV